MLPFRYFCWSFCLYFVVGCSDKDVQSQIPSRTQIHLISEVSQVDIRPVLDILSGDLGDQSAFRVEARTIEVKNDIKCYLYDLEDMERDFLSSDILCKRAGETYLEYTASEGLGDIILLDSGELIAAEYQPAVNTSTSGPSFYTVQFVKFGTNGQLITSQELIDEPEESELIYYSYVDSLSDPEIERVEDFADNNRPVVPRRQPSQFLYKNGKLLFFAYIYGAKVYELDPADSAMELGNSSYASPYMVVYDWIKYLGDG